MLGYGTDHIGLVEIKLDTMYQEVRQQTRDESKQRLQTSSVNMASSWIPVQNVYKPGGVMSIAQGDVLGQKIMDGSDLLRQWVYMKYATKGDKIVTVVAAYQPCKAHKLTETMTYHQQIAMLKQQH
eukprot:7729444-Ditylum_brightwellii.AAC.1